MRGGLSRLLTPVGMISGSLLLILSGGVLIGQNGNFSSYPDPFLNGGMVDGTFFQGTPVIQGTPMIQGSSNLTTDQIYQGLPMDAVPVIPGGNGPEMMNSPNFLSIPDLNPSPNYGPYGPNNPPPIVDLRQNEDRKLRGVIEAQQVPDRETIRKAIEQQLIQWSPERNLVELIDPATVLKMTLPYGVDARFLCRTRNQNPSGDRTTGTAGMGSTSEPAYAVGILCWNIPVGNLRLLSLENGLPIVRIGYHYQQNRGELLAVLAMSSVSSDYEIRIADRSLTIEDLIESEKRGISFQEDHSMAAIGLSFYLRNVEETWTNGQGESVSLLKLADYEMNRPVFWNRNDSVNRLLGLTFLSDRFHREMESGNPSPEMREMTKRIDDYLEMVRQESFSDLNDAGLRTTRFLSDEKIRTAADVLLVNGHFLRWQILTADRFTTDTEQLTKSIYHLALTLAQFYNPQTSKLNAFSPREVEAIAISLQAESLFLKKYLDDDFSLQ